MALRSPQEPRDDNNIKIPRGGIGSHNRRHKEDAGSQLTQPLQRSNKSPNPNNLSSSLQLKTDQKQSKSAKFWQPGSIVPNLQAKPDNKKKGNKWSRFKKALGIGGDIAFSGSLMTGILGTAGVAGVLAGPVGWGLLAGAGLLGLGYGGYKAYKRYKRRKEREKKALKKSDLKPGDILLYGGNIGPRIGQVAASIVRVCLNC